MATSAYTEGKTAGLQGTGTYDARMNPFPDIPGTQNQRKEWRLGYVDGWKEHVSKWFRFDPEMRETIARKEAARRRRERYSSWPWQNVLSAQSSRFLASVTSEPVSVPLGDLQVCSTAGEVRAVLWQNIDDLCALTKEGMRRFSRLDQIHHDWVSIPAGSGLSLSPCPNCGKTITIRYFLRKP